MGNFISSLFGQTVITTLFFLALCAFERVRQYRAGFRYNKSQVTGKVRWSRVLSDEEVMALPCETFIKLDPRQRRLEVPVYYVSRRS